MDKASCFQALQESAKAHSLLRAAGLDTGGICSSQTYFVEEKGRCRPLRLVHCSIGLL